MAFVCALSVIISLVLLVLSIYPGVLPDLLFLGLLSSPFWFPGLCLLGVFFINLSHDTPSLHRPPFLQRRSAKLSLTVLVLNSVLLWTDIPCRLGFLLSQPEFSALAESVPVPLSERGILEYRAGLFKVDRCDTDPRGGLYFRTHRGSDGLRPREISYGFARRPNPSGSPFGNVNYRRSHLIGDWYCFAASNEFQEVEGDRTSKSPLKRATAHVRRQTRWPGH